MSQGGEAADEIVRLSGKSLEAVGELSLKGIEMMLRISGVGAKNLAAYLYAVLSSNTKSKGKTRLVNMLRSGKELKVFSIKNEDLEIFVKEAKEYGVLYCALKDKTGIDGMTDIMVQADQAAIINRIIDRFHLATVDTAEIKNDIQNAQQQEQTEGPEDVPEHEKGTPAEMDADAFLDEMLASEEGQPPPQPKMDNTRTEQEPNAGEKEDDAFRPSKARTRNALPSGPTSRQQERESADITDTADAVIVIGYGGEITVIPSIDSLKEEMGTTFPALPAPEQTKGFPALPERKSVRGELDEIKKRRQHDKNLPGKGLGDTQRTDSIPKLPQPKNTNKER